MAKLIGYPDPEKAYLAGLLHDLGILVNIIACSEDYPRASKPPAKLMWRCIAAEEEHLGFTHCQSGKILAEQWHFSSDVIEVIEFSPRCSGGANLRATGVAGPSQDLLCRLRDLGYGYYEAMGMDLAGDAAWATLVGHYPALATMDLASLYDDIDGAMEEIVAVVDAVFKP